MIKVIQFIPGLTMGGAETLVKDYCLKFDKKIIDLTLLCTIKRDTYYEHLLEEAGIKIIYVNDYSKKSPKLIEKVLIYIMRYFKIKKILKNERPDVIHIHLNLCRLIKFSKIKCKMFLTVHNSPDFVWKNKREEDAVKWLIKHRNMKLISLHEQMRLELNKRFNVNNTITVNNGIDFEKFNIAVSKNEIRKELNLPIDSTIIGHIGRFRNEKNHNYLVDIFKKYKEKNSKAHLLLIGDGNLKNSIIEKLNSYGLLNDYTLLSNRPDIPYLMKCMDFFILPSYVEGLPVVLVEAQKSGLKCIVSKEAVVKDVILSNRIIYESINSPTEVWVNDILNYPNDDIIYYNIDEWDINNVVSKLANYYIK